MNCNLTHIMCKCMATCNKRPTASTGLTYVACISENLKHRTRWCESCWSRGRHGFRCSNHTSASLWMTDSALFTVLLMHYIQEARYNIITKLHGYSFFGHKLCIASFQFHIAVNDKQHKIHSNVCNIRLKVLFYTFISAENISVSLNSNILCTV